MTIQDDLIAAVSADEPFKQGKKESYDDFRKRLLVAVTELNDDDYAALPKPAKKWIKVAVDAFNEDGDVPDFPDNDSAPAVKVTAAPKKKAPAPEPDEAEDEPEEVEDEPEEDDEPEDEPEEDDEPAPPPAKKRGRPAKPKAAPPEEEEDEDDEPAPAPKKRGRPAKAKAPPPEEEEESDPVHEIDDEEPDPEPVDKKKSKPVKAAKEEEEAPKPKANGHTNGRSSGGGLALMRTLLAKDPNLSPREILERCQESGYTIDIHTIASNKSTFMAAIRTLQGLNMLRKNVF